MGILAWILFGLLAGIFAKLIIPGFSGGGKLIVDLLTVQAVASVQILSSVILHSNPAALRCEKP